MASASPLAREGGSPWAGMSGAGVIADNHLVGVITVDPARYQDRLVAVPASGLLDRPGFRDRLAAHGVPAEVARVGDGWYLRLPGGQTVSLAPAYRPVSRRLPPAPSTLLHPEHGLVPFLGRQAVLDQVTGWCQDLAVRPLLLVTGGGGSGKTRLGREACVRMLVSGWDAGLADDQRCDGTAITQLRRRTLLVVDNADLNTGLISALVDYIGGDYGGPPVGLLLLARAAGDWWDRLLLQKGLDNAYAVLDLDRHPIPPADRTEHFRCASAAFAAYGGPGARSADLPPSELEDQAYAEPLLIHIAALLRTLDTTAAPPGSGRKPAPDDTGSQQGSPVRQRLLRALCERERTRWYELGAESYLTFNKDLPLANQVVALATLTAADDQPSALFLLAAVPSQAEVTRLGAEALAAWAHKLYAGPGYWNPLRPDLLAEQHLADTAQLPTLVTAAAQIAAGREWEAGLLTRLLAESTRGAPNQPAVRAALNELLAAALDRIVHLAVTADKAALADLVSLALQLAPQPGLAAALADQMPPESVRLAGLAATLTSQQVTDYRAGMADGGADAASRLAGALVNLSRRLAALGRRADALDASEEAVGIYRGLAAAGSDVPEADLARSLTIQSNDLAALGRLDEALVAVNEAVEIYGQLAAAGSDVSKADLARSLTIQCNDLAALGRLDEALVAVNEAVKIYGQLAAAGSDVLEDMAKMLSDRSVILIAQGRQRDALAAAQEAVGIYRRLADVRPDAFEPDLAKMLNNESSILVALGRRREAVAPINQAVQIYRRLADVRPDAFEPDLAKMLNNQSIILAPHGQRQLAIEDAARRMIIRPQRRPGEIAVFGSEAIQPRPGTITPCAGSRSAGCSLTS